MADFVGGIKQIGPSYPVKPVMPAQKEREPDDRSKKQPQPTSEKRDDDDKPTIDELV